MCGAPRAWRPGGQSPSPRTLTAPGPLQTPPCQTLHAHTLHTRTPVRVHHTHMHALMHVQAHAHILMHTHPLAHTHTCPRRSRVQTFMCAHILTCTPTRHTHTHHTPCLPPLPALTRPPGGGSLTKTLTEPSLRSLLPLSRSPWAAAVLAPGPATASLQRAPGMRGGPPGGHGTGPLLQCQDSTPPAPRHGIPSHWEPSHPPTGSHPR